MHQSSQTSMQCPFLEVSSVSSFSDIAETPQFVAFMLKVSKMDIDVTDTGIPTPPDAGPLEEETSIPTVIGEVQDFEQPPQQIIPEQAPDEVAPEFVELLQPQVQMGLSSVLMLLHYNYY